jgi:hypothetical protein
LAVVPVTVTPVTLVKPADPPVIEVNWPEVPVIVTPLIVPVTLTPEPKKPEPLTVRSPETVVLVNVMLEKIPVAAETVVPLIVTPVREVKLPVVISCQKGMAEQRIPNMRGIMAARTKPLKVLEPIEASATTSIKKFDTPLAKSGVKLVDPSNMDELVRLLKEEAKVI